MLFDQQDFAAVTSAFGRTSALFAKMLSANVSVSGLRVIGERLIAVEAEVLRLREENPPKHRERKIKVTLLASDNQYLRYPCEGLLDIWELGTDGSVITKVFHRKEPDGRYGPPVAVDGAVWMVGKLGS